MSSNNVFICLAFVFGNVTDETLEQFYLQQQDGVQDLNPHTGGETTHARKEVTPGKLYYQQIYEGTENMKSEDKIISSLSV